MQFLTIVILPAESLDAVEAITHLMAPYDIARTGAARKEYARQTELDYLIAVSEQTGLNRDDVEAVVAELEADTGLVCGHDAGGFWWITTDNPQGEWDGWELEHLQDDSWPAMAPLPEDLYPAAIVTSDGVWHDLGARWDMSDEQAQALRVT